MAVTNAKLPAKTPLDPVGNPAGGTSFTLWQSGQVLFDNRGKDGSIQRTGVLTWSTAFPAWSPDGRYLLNFIYVIGRLELPGQPRPSPQILASLQVGKAPLLAMRDMALQRIVETMPEDLYSAENLLLSWRPDGLVLAASGSFIDALGLFDCATGKKIASLVLPTYRASGSSYYYLGSSLRWSPDGSQLLMLAPGIGATVWNVK